MSFIPAKCTQCGATIEVDDAKDAGICRHCGTAYVTQKAIHNYNTYFTQNIVLGDVAGAGLLGGTALMTVSAAAEQCERLHQLKDYDALDKLAKDVMGKWPLSYVGYKYAIMNYRLYSRQNDSDYAQAVQTMVRAAAGLADWRHETQDLLKKMLERMTPEERENNKDFIENVKNIIYGYMRELKTALKRRPKIMGCIFASVSVVIAFLSILTATTGAFGSEDWLTFFGVALFILVPIAFVFCIVFLFSIGRLKYIPFIDEEMEVIKRM